MRQCLVWASLACLLAVGCAHNGLTSGRQAGYVTASQRAPRPTISRGFRKPGPEPAVQLAAYADSCCDPGCACEEGCGCPVDGCCGADGCCPNCGGYGCNGGCGPCRRLIDGVAGGFCGPCGPGGYGLCPNGQTYPEYPTFNQGPPTGQVAYPYYTVRGPRDFLRDNPPTIGPY